ncbi:hypothetical protein [Thalassotalea sp. G2M2-11]|uniref:hypothetical protein n=1 Tax=Thalassotalea sp. G2M2-11 TaxID=2787627 RepID=UPI0019D25818|nr:hypothetical protein [Thalassotalea sp. G2M2-11]
MEQPLNYLAKTVIEKLQDHIKALGFTPVIHFELEGCYQSNSPLKSVDFTLINQRLEQLKIAGKVIPEYWHQQWEYVSLFHGQSPLEEAEYLNKVIQLLPTLFAEQGIEQTFIRPVVWAGDKGKLAQGCQNIFSGDERAVHIPNAIQMNVSVNDGQGDNIMTEHFFGEYLQYCFLQTSLPCSLLYLPEQEAFDRFDLKTKFGLAEELCSPNDISGGHQGSIALYKQLGKHNQAMGVKPLLYDHHHNVIASECCWRETARVEHRLGAASVLYNAYVNVVFALLNIIDALEVYLEGACREQTPDNVAAKPLPHTLYSCDEAYGAIALFEQEQWFARRIDQLTATGASSKTLDQGSQSLGRRLKAAILSPYQPANIIT